MTPNSTVFKSASGMNVFVLKSDWWAGGQMQLCVGNQNTERRNQLTKLGSEV